jgi:uncharacterized protein
MSLEVRPLGVRCNIGCEYCYQEPQREAGNLGGAYDLDAMKQAIAKHSESFTLFGGEPLMVPLRDLENLWAFGFARHGENGVQTNGSLIDDSHIALFRKYAVRVGISIDGPGELNDARWAGTLARTRAATARTEAAIAKLCDLGMPPGLIVTLHRGNATAEKLPVLHEWMFALERRGIRSVRLHILEVDKHDVRSRLALTDEENIEAFLSFARLEDRLEKLRFDVFNDLRMMLLGRDDQTSCVWRSCDPYTTSAVQGIEGRGQSSNCGRTNKDGVDFVKADKPGYERYLALYHTPQAANGCSGCRFFLMCRGQCPGTAVDGDWRNRTEHCEVWKHLFRYFEDRFLDQGIVPVSAKPERKALEMRAIDFWSRGENVSMRQLLLQMSVEDAGRRLP